MSNEATTQSAANTEPIPGYKLLEHIGTGGYGEVWKADAPGGLAKAVKLVFGYLEGERASRELKALGRIKEARHPFLLSLERIEVANGQLVIVTELADMSLKDRFDQCTASGLPGIPREELLVYLHDAADALDFMRENHSLQHLDVKPENLLLVGGRVKVADFGLVKDIQDTNASLMGGMTPNYAPPEVFDGRASQQSDQYSLAIVFQEMLTGKLPFTGRTLAQLATQHLQGTPDLSSLPQADQTIVGTSLAKEPGGRFPSCRELIENLMDAGRPTAGSGPPKPVEITHPPAASDRKPSGPPSSTVVLDSTGSAQPAAAPPPSPAPCATQVLTSVPDGAENLKPITRHHTPLLSEGPAPAVRDLPSIDLDNESVGLRPTLFVGIGGTAARVLRQLRHRLADQFGSPAAVPALQMLLMETDPAAVREATEGSAGIALDHRDVLSLPLRRPQDYRDDSKNILRWLSRRWIYNIPRSLETQGFRPLGRLALVDHANDVFARLRAAVEAIADPPASEAYELRSASPRVVVVASISGGTGSGMVIDVGYALRKVLGDLALADVEVSGMLTHSTNRNPDDKDLAIANAYACLSELHHFTRAGGRYPGDSACGLPAFEGGDNAAFRHTYLVHLGDDLGEEQFADSTDQLADYLYRDAVTPAGAFFETCRRIESDERSTNPPTSTLRSFGLSRLGFCSDEVAQAAADLVCRTVAEQWLRGGRENPAPRAVDQAPPEAAVKKPARKNWRDFIGSFGSKTDGPAADEVQAAEENAPRRGPSIEEIVQHELGAKAEETFCSRLAELCGRHGFGAAADDDENQPPTALQPNQVKRLVTQLRGLRKALESLLEEDRQAPADETGTQDEPPADESPDAREHFRRLVHETLRREVPALAARLQENLIQELPVPEDESEDTVESINLRDVLLTALRQAAQRAVAAALTDIDLADVMLPAKGDREEAIGRLRELLQTAEPPMMACGGGKRLLLTVPQGSSSQRLREVFQRELEVDPSIHADANDDIVFCTEAQQLPLLGVAAWLIDNRADYAQAASRLHTRIDVDWTPTG